MIKFLFRKPKFPILIETDNRAYGIKSIKKIEKLINSSLFLKQKTYRVIDSSGEGWWFLPEHITISPLTNEKQWTKKTIIDFFNSSLDSTKISIRYKCNSLSSKRLNKLIEEIVDLSEQL